MTFAVPRLDERALWPSRCRVAGWQCCHQGVVWQDGTVPTEVAGQLCGHRGVGGRMAPWAVSPLPVSLAMAPSGS